MPSWKKVILSGSDATLNSLYVSGPITGSDVQINAWGSISASLAAINATGSTQNLQQVTDNGNTTTNSINVAGITNNGNLFLSGSNRLVYNNSNTNSMLFGFFDGGNIYGPYYQIFGNNYSNATQRGSAEFVYDNRNGGESGFNIASFNGSTWTRKFRTDDNGIQVTGSAIATLGFTGSLQGTASFATSASHTIFEDTASFLPSTTNLNVNSISASNAVFQSASIGYLTTVTGSATIIGDAFILLNTNDAQRYAGLLVEDSGSAPTNYTASFFYDSQTNDWNYEYTTPGGTDFGVALFGPEYNTKGSPTYLTANTIPKAEGTHHLIDSNISDNGTRVSTAVSLTVTGSITASTGFSGDLTGTASYASQALTASYVATASYTPTLQQVTSQSNITNTSVTFTGSSANSLQIVNSGGDIPFISVSGSVNTTPGRLVDVIYSATYATTNSTTTIAQLPAPKVAGFTFDYVAYASGGVLQAGRAGVVKGILRNTETGVVTKAFQINETTTLDLEDDGFGTAGLQFNIIQDTNGTSNQLVAITNSNWNYTINYTLTIYYNPDFS